MLKDVLSVPTCTYKEDKMVEFLKNYLTEKNYDFFVDKHKNVYVTKTSPEFEGQPFPCVVAHTDTVHWDMKPINIKEEMKRDFQHQEKLALKGYDDEGNPVVIEEKVAGLSPDQLRAQDLARRCWYTRFILTRRTRRLWPRCFCFRGRFGPCKRLGRTRTRCNQDRTR